MYYESYNVTVEKGKGYLFTLNATQPAYKTRALVSGDNVYDDSSSLYLAVESPNYGDPMKPAPIFFVAPRTGTYSLRAFTRDRDELFDYSLTASECAPRAIDISGSFADDSATLTDDDCMLEQPYLSYANRGGSWTYTPSNVALYPIYFDGYSDRTITLTSDDFVPTMMVEGPGFDAWCNTFFCDGHTYQNGSFVDSLSVTTKMWIPGTYTLAIGSMVPGETGTFKLSISAPHDPLGPALLLPKPWDELQPGQWKKMKAPR